MTEQNTPSLPLTPQPLKLFCLCWESGVAASYGPSTAARGVWVRRLGLCGGSHRAAEHGSFRMWFIIGSVVYISSRACAAHGAVHRGKKEKTERKWLSEMFAFVCVSFFWRAAVWKEGAEMLNYMWQLGNWPCFRIWILRRRRTELLVGRNEQLSQLVCFV